MASTSAQPKGAPEPPRRWHRRVLALVIAACMGATLSVSYALYRNAERQWAARAESEAQRLSTVLLGWIDDSYAPLSGLAALAESTHGGRPAEFLNAFDGMESRATPVLLGAVALLERDAKGRWELVISSGNFEFLKKEADAGFVTIQPLINFARARPNQFVLGPPVRSGDGRAMSPVMIALSRVKRPTVLVGKVEYSSVETALLGTPAPKGFYLTLQGKFMDVPKLWPIVQAEPDQPVIDTLVTRAATGGADLEIVWRVTREYLNGPDYRLPAMTLAGGMTATVLIAMFMASLIERNRVINEKVTLATTALRVSGEEQLAILESATLGIAFIKNRIIMRTNSRLDELFGFGRREQIGQPTRIWYPDDESHAAVGEAYEQLARGETHQRELLLRRKNGDLFWCRLSGRAVQAGDLSRGTVWMLEDITERRRAEDEIREARHRAEEATEMKSMFLANMSHEIRTPMNAIIGLSDLVLRTPLNAKQRDYMTKVHQAGTALVDVINGILDFSKIEAGRLDLESIDFGMDQVIANVITMTAQRAHAKGLEFLTQVSPAIPPSLRGDPLRLGQVLTNLVDNAVKFTERGEIRLTVDMLEQRNEEVQLTCAVRDTGIGMTPEQTAKLFQPFTQADMSTTRTHGGTGLGLTISRRLVEAMKGSLWLESEPGAGSTFFFTVWLERGSPTGSEHVPGRLADLRVLVVDDSVAAREILREPLQSLSRRVDLAASGPEAIAAITREDAGDPYDIVFMDWRMPGMDGLQASRQIRNDASVKHQPAIVLVTAFEEVREKAEGLPLDGFLTKPLTASMIRGTLTKVFAGPRPDGVAARRGKEGGLRGARILLTEDNEINQQIAVELLESAGAAVRLANNGREAVEILLNGPPLYDLVLMDLQMPVMDGYQATARIRGDQRFANLPIVAMTAHATIEERARCLAAGMTDHISKPVDSEELFGTLARYYRPSGIAVDDSNTLGAMSHDGIGALPWTGESSAETVTLPSVEGLDVSSGLLRVGGNRELYVTLLRQFIHEQGDVAVRIRDLLEAGHNEVAARLVHTLRGLAGNLGADGVQGAAAELETGMASPVEASRIEAMRQQLAEELARLHDHLRPVLAARPTSVTRSPGTSVDADAMTVLVAQMRIRLGEFDPGAVEYLELHRAAFGSLLSPADLLRFEQCIQSYAFSEAEAVLEQAVKIASDMRQGS
jgi:PAS domain S-box-containing protein